MNKERKIDRIREKTIPFKVWDLVVYAAVLVAVVFLIISLTRPQGSMLEITYYNAENQRQTVVLSLSKDTEYRIPADALPEGAEVVIVIEGGFAYVRESTCHNQICVHMGKISRVGQEVICSPYRIVLTVTGESFGDVWV